MAPKEQFECEDCGQTFSEEDSFSDHVVHARCFEMFESQEKEVKVKIIDKGEREKRNFKNKKIGN